MLMVILACIIIDNAHAITINPSRAEFTVVPNKKYVSKYAIINNDTKPAKAQVFVEKDKIFERSGDATPWIKISPAIITIPANSSRTVNCVVQVPDGLKGEYTASLVFRSVSATKIDVLNVNTQISLVAYVIIKDTEVVDGEISGVEIAKVDPLKVNVKLKNTGNIHVRPTGEVKIFGFSEGAENNEDEAANLMLNYDELPLFPDAEGTIYTKDTKISLEPGKYKAHIKLEFTPDFILEKEVNFTVTGEKNVQME